MKLRKVNGKLEIVRENLSEEQVNSINKAKEERKKRNKENSERAAKNRGFKNDSERRTFDRWNSGKVTPMSKKDCESRTGIYIGERKIAVLILSNIFEKVEMMSTNNKGFDSICSNPKQEFIEIYPQFTLEKNKEYKIQVKTSHHIKDFWKYSIRYDSNPDYFLLLGLEEKEDTLLHSWLFNKSVIIKNKNNYLDQREFWNRSGLKIGNRNIFRYRTYELPNNLKDNKFSVNDSI